ncbi:MAG: hypothetical protein NT018_08370 [Armatimonadetes bacterium]|nr:hypothetical protein [Armatimonadota bacterium]
MPVSITVNDFLNDTQGAKFADVVKESRINFQSWLNFFNDPVRQQRMEDSETHHLRPALAGVIIELENDPAFKSFLANNDAHTTRRGRQAIGVIVRIIMERLGWTIRLHAKGSLGQRARTTPGTVAPGSYYNTSGLSKWFTKAQHYDL